MVATLTRTPRCCCSWVQSSARVASGWAWTSWRTRARADGSQWGWRPPACGRGTIAPVVHRRCINCSTKPRLTPNKAARTRCEPRPWS